MKIINMKINEGNYFYVENPKYHPDLKNKIMVVVGAEKLRKDEGRRVKLNHINDDDNIVLPAVSQFEKFIKPIQITKDWLFNFEFEMSYQNQKAQIGSYILSKSPNGWKLYFQFSDQQIYLGVELKYVHELQNSFSSLTGYDLTL